MKILVVRLLIVDLDRPRMAGVQDQLEIKFRLTDGSDIGPKSFPLATSVATLKEDILAQWPKGLLSCFFLVFCMFEVQFYNHQRWQSAIIVRF